MNNQTEALRNALEKIKERLNRFGPWLVTTDQLANEIYNIAETALAAQSSMDQPTGKI